MTSGNKAAVPHSEIQQLDISTLRPYWRNPRKIDDAVQFVTKAIERYGFQVPIVVDEEHVIINGHTRYMAALQLGLKTVPVIVAKLTPEQAREFRIADNKIPEKTHWNYEKLTGELVDLSDIKSVSETFNCPEWDSLLSAVYDDNEDGEGGEGENTPTDGSGPPADDTEAPGEANGESTEKLEVVCPHCGKVNHVG